MELNAMKGRSNGDSGSPAMRGDGPTVAGLQPVLSAFLQAQAGLLEEAVRNQGDKIEQAKVLMSEAVQAFGTALQELDVLARDQYQLAMGLHQVLEVHLEGEQEAKSVEDFTRRIVGTLDVFVQAMLEIGQSSFQLVEEMDGIKSRSASMVESLVELAEVAMRIQMLSLNASIEAAHPGSSGPASRWWPARCRSWRNGAASSATSSRVRSMRLRRRCSEPPPRWRSSPPRNSTRSSALSSWPRPW